MRVFVIATLGEGRLVVVSPHIDDAVFSLGASLAGAVRAGTTVEILTVFAGDPQSRQAAGRWDSAAGFRTEGEAVRARREEDRRACAVVGASPRWLAFPDKQYARRASDDEMLTEVLSVCEGAGAVLVPGFPLRNQDHRAISEWVLGQDISRAGRVGLYVEQPYAVWAASIGRPVEAPEWLSSPDGGAPEFLWSTPGARDLALKWRALGKYRSQLPLLGGLIGRPSARSMQVRLAIVRAGEAVAWLEREPQVSANREGGSSSSSAPV